MSFAITYETLFDLLRKESSREDLQVLPATFYDDVASFIAEKKRDSESGDSSGHRAGIEYQNTKKIVKEFYERRERKILLLALNKARTESAIIDPSILLEKERKLFDTVVAELKNAKSEIMLDLESGTPKPQEVQEESSVKQTETVPEHTLEVATPQAAAPSTAPVTLEEKMLKVKFLAAVPKFIGKDMTIFGPFNPGDTSELPSDVAQVLLKKGRIEEIS